MSDSLGFEDWRAIVEGKARYCRYLDNKQWAEFATLFTEDFELDVSDGTGLAPIRGRDEAVAMVRASVETTKTAHQVHNPEMRVDGEGIEVTWAMQDRVIWDADRALTGYGNYHERWVKRDGEWKIARLKLTRLILEMTTEREESP